MDVHLGLASDNPNKETGVIHISIVGFKQQFKSFILLLLSYCEIDSSFLVNLLDFDLTQSCFKAIKSLCNQTALHHLQL